ncbi:MAG: MerR family transcriptional regulator [Defluviitaleaceae bacterium]|nr:MerR family transcriptional regulator [Defluviitaleaceae bacterium]
MNKKLKEKLITIGDLAKLANAPIQSIRYYEKVGLLKPIFIDKVTSYRYFSVEQARLVETIRFCIELDFPLKELTSYVNEEGTLDYIGLLTKSRELAKAKTDRLLKGLEQISETEKLIAESSVIELEKIYQRESAPKILTLEPEKNLGDGLLCFYSVAGPKVYSFKELPENSEGQLTLPQASYLFIHTQTKTIEDAAEIFADYINTAEPFITIEKSIITGSYSQTSPVREIAVTTGDN